MSAAAELPAPAAAVTSGFGPVPAAWQTAAQTIMACLEAAVLIMITITMIMILTTTLMVLTMVMYYDSRVFY